MSEPRRRPITFDDLWSLPRDGGPTLSPDGRRVVWPRTTYDLESDEATSHLWLAELDGETPPRRLTFSPGRRRQAAWSADGETLVYVVVRDDEPARLELLRLSGGEPEPLIELPVAARAPRFLPDDSGLVFAAVTWPGVGVDLELWKERVKEAEESPVRISERRLLRYWDEYRTDGSTLHFFHLDFASGELRDLMPGFAGLIHFRELHWDLAPDGGELAFAANVTAEPWHELRFAVHRLPLAGGEPEPLLPDHPGWDEGPVYSPDGRRLLFGRVPDPDRAAQLTRLMRWDRARGEVVALTAEWDREPAGWRFADDGETVLFHAQDRGRRHLWAMPVTGGTPRIVVRGGTIGGTDAGPNGRLAYLRQSFHRPPAPFVARLAMRRGDGAEEPPRVVDERALVPVDPRLDDLDLGGVEERRFAGADGDQVQTFVVTPPGFDPARRWPLVLAIHGGPHSAWLDQWHQRWSAPLLAAPGYVVLMVNPHGSTGFGQAFAESILGDHAGKPFADLMAAVDALLAEGWVDEDRLAAAGGSYGGYLVAWILGHSDRFRALIDHAGVYDLMAQWASDYTWTRANSYGAAPWDDPARVDRASPSRHAARFATPTLILHGERDYRVPYTQSLNLYGVLQAKGVRSRIVVFPRENHWIEKPRAARLWWREVHGWLAEHVPPGPR